MVDEKLYEAYEKLASLSHQAEKDKRYFEALRYGIAIFLAMYDSKQEVINLLPYVLIRAACNGILEATSTNTAGEKQGNDKRSFCSFCGKEPPEVRLTAGRARDLAADVYICNECSVLVAKIFKE